MSYKMETNCDSTNHPTHPDSGIVLGGVTNLKSKSAEDITHGKPNKEFPISFSSSSNESTVLRWVKQDKECKDNKAGIDFEDYSILMYETQDAFNHMRNVRFKLKNCEDQLRAKTRQYEKMVAEKKKLQKQINTLNDSSDRKNESQLRQRLQEVSKRNEYLEEKNKELEKQSGKYEKQLDCLHVLKETRDKSATDELGDIKNDSERCDINIADTKFQSEENYATSQDIKENDENTTLQHENQAEDIGNVLKFFHAVPFE